VAERLRFLRPATSFRSAYAYDNVLYIVAGELVEAVSGESWEAFVTSRILKRVGMTGSNVSHSAAANQGNVAATHARVDGVVRRIAPFLSDTTNAAGGINSSASDMAKWLQLLLGHGALPDGSRLFSEATARELETIVTPLPTTDPPQGLAALRAQFSGYALGLGVRDYRGHRVLAHSGGLPGYVSRVLMVPDTRLGIAVLTNQESEAAYNAIVYRVVDQYLGATGMDWLAAFRKSEADAQQRAGSEKRAGAARDQASRPSLPLLGYAGKYQDAWYGDIDVALEDGRLVMRFSHTPGLVGDLEHWQHDTFVARWRDRELRADAYVAFALSPDGTIDQVKLKPVSAATDFSFDFQDLLLRPAASPSGR
jgi:CubicO group peptidase (beta-lactamase class C family)